MTLTVGPLRMCSEADRPLTRRLRMKRWEAKDMGCGQLVFELARQLETVDPGDRLEVITHEPGAKVDLPAWCRMTGHELVTVDGPTFVIQRRFD